MGADSDVFNDFLRESDPCFGEHFAKTADECKKCTAPVIWQDGLYLLRDVCKAVSSGAVGPSKVKRLTSQDVLERIQEGASVEEIFREILSDADPDVAATAARQVLYNRLYYLENKYDLPMPDLPRTKEMLE